MMKSLLLAFAGGETRALWTLYWGALYFIETERLGGGGVLDAMNGLGRRLRAGASIEGDIAALEAAAEQMLRRCATSRARSSRDRRPS